MIWNRPVLIFALLCAVVSLEAFAPVRADEHEKGDIIVEISGAGSNDGKILWRMFSNKQTFENPEDGGVTEGECELEDYKCTFVIPEINFGEYAIMAGHDLNNDQEISKSPFSAEKKAITNYDEKIYWFPDFKKAKFPHSEGSTMVRMKLY
ncbi:MAG: DUF2141 domain-containing protein [Hyphomicrobiales bacterium]